ncbi:MAG: pentapeptide repeat-containing protein [Desulfobaccales bacterium]|nr:pentapeptide repeat-containing protein [Desulfobaccales bacterium]
MDQDLDRKVRKAVADFFVQAPQRYPAASVALVSIILVLLIWMVPYLQVPESGLNLKERLHQINENRKTVAQIVGGVFILVGLYIAWVRSKAMRDQAEVDREQQLTDLYVKAIEQLGSEKLQIRLGGIYALERIARESAKDHWPIMEVLTAFVRENAPRHWENLSGLQPGEDDVSPPPPYKPTTDVQAVLTIIGRRTRTFGQGEEQPLDLRETHLAGADLRHAKFQGALLAEANLQRAVLWHANLQGANLWQANLQRADLMSANLHGALLMSTNFQWASLSGAKLQWAQLTGANLQRTNLNGANLMGANLQKANLQETSLMGANLQGTILAEAKLQGADLQEAEGLTLGQIAGALWDESTHWPKGFSPPLKAK